MGEGEEKIRLHAAIVCLANAVHWIDGSSDWCGSGRSIASCQSRSRRNIHFPGLRLGTFLISWFIRILKILILPWGNAFGSLGYAYRLSIGARARGYYTIVETRFIGFIFHFSDLTMIATNGERFSSWTAILLSTEGRRDIASSPNIHSSQEKQSVSVPKEWYCLPTYSAVLHG